MNTFSPPALFRITMGFSHPRCPSVGEWIRKILVYTYRTYYVINRSQRILQYHGIPIGLEAYAKHWSSR